MTEDQRRDPEKREATRQVDEVADEVVRRDVGGLDRAVVPGPPPVLASTQLLVAVLVDLDDGEGRRDEDVMVRRLDERRHVLEVGQRHSPDRPVRLWPSRRS